MTKNRCSQNPPSHSKMRIGQLCAREQRQAQKWPLTAHASTISQAFESGQLDPKCIAPDPSQLPKRQH